jgi:hypothetical protein
VYNTASVLFDVAEQRQSDEVSAAIQRAAHLFFNCSFNDVSYANLK